MKPIVGILLAAGASRRFGSDKLLKSLPEGGLVAVRACVNLLAGVDHVVSVVRLGDEELAARLKENGAEVVVFADAAQGMGSSLAYAVRSSMQESTGWLVALADMPWILPATIHRVASEIQRGGEIVAPVYRGQRGHPVGFSSGYREALSALNGDSGAKSLIMAHHERLQLVEVYDPGVVRDIDLPCDLTST